MKQRSRAWRYATVVVVALVVLNPEMVEVALFIDAIGLDVFLMLLEVQVLAMLGAFLSNGIKPVISRMKHLFAGALHAGTVKKMKAGADYLVVSMPIEAALMHLLVISAIVGGAVDVWL